MTFSEWFEKERQERALDDDDERICLLAWNAARLDLLEALERDGLLAATL